MNRVGENNPKWKGGGRINNGYVFLYMPDHPWARGCYISEHRYVVYEAMGKKLPPRAQIHHLDGNPGNNDKTNLVVCEDKKYHALLHVRQRIKESGGNPTTDKICAGCGLVKHKSEFTVSSDRGDGLDKYCKECKFIRGTAEKPRRRERYKEKVGREIRMVVYPETRRSR